MLRLRPRAKKRGNSLLLRKEKIGKCYNNFLELLKNDPSLTYVEMDTLIGKIRDSKCILSLHIPKIKFQFYFLLNGKDSSDVTNKLNEILNIIGIDNYKKIFGVILTDNGSEFTDIRGIEMDPDTGEVKTNLYFCHPGACGEKGSCERNHELFRYIIPKGTSFDGLTQEHLNIITSHVNSYKRKSTDYSTPLELFRAYFGPEILDKFNISLIEPNSVTLTPDLIK
jgi:IS30 family transposase